MAMLTSCTVIRNTKFKISPVSQEEASTATTAIQEVARKYGMTKKHANENDSISFTADPPFPVTVGIRYVDKEHRAETILVGPFLQPPPELNAINQDIEEALRAKFPKRFKVVKDR